MQNIKHTEPEADPGDDHQHTSRNVDLEQVVTELSFEQEIDS